MAYNYLIDLYSYLEAEISQLQKKMESATITENEKAHTKGMIQEFTELELFLQKNYNKMLPSKIRKKLEESGPHGIN